jgi:hypothetical protein
VPDVADAKTRAHVHIIDPKAAPVKLGAGRISLYCVTRALRALGVIPMDALEAAAARGGGDYAQENVETIRLALGDIGA